MHVSLVLVFGFIASGQLLGQARRQQGSVDLQAQTEPPPIALPHPELDPPVDIMPTWPLWLIIGGAMILAILVGLVIWLLIKFTPRPKPPVVPPLVQALERLHGLRTTLDQKQISPSDASHHVSVILRDYQLARYGSPAPYRTTEELYPPHPAASDPLNLRFGGLARLYDRLAFAPQVSTSAEIESLITDAEAALTEEKKYQTTAPRHALEA